MKKQIQQLEKRDGFRSPKGYKFVFIPPKNFKIEKYSEQTVIFLEPRLYKINDKQFGFGHRKFLLNQAFTYKVRHSRHSGRLFHHCQEESDVLAQVADSGDSVSLQ